MRHQQLLNLLYPPQCLTCDQVVLTPNGFCPTCRAQIKMVQGLTCDLCAVPLLGESEEMERCDACLQDPPPWRAGRAAMLYSGKGREMVLALKHHDRLDIIEPAAKLMTNALETLKLNAPLFVPVPSHWRRTVLRRYNQAGLLAQAVARHCGASCAPRALIRVRHTPLLGHENRATRVATLSNSIEPHPRFGKELVGRNIVLVDDVMTSGATLRACSEAATRTGAADICVLALARAVERA